MCLSNENAIKKKKESVIVQNPIRDRIRRETLRRRLAEMHFNKVKLDLKMAAMILYVHKCIFNELKIDNPDLSEKEYLEKYEFETITAKIEFREAFFSIRPTATLHDADEMIDEILELAKFEAIHEIQEYYGQRSVPPEEQDDVSEEPDFTSRDL